uniref:CARD domain-containing protein n=1 Tax=Poecilia reticulata TaxID=8081 RepID=A0A3P9P1Y0_POERE
LLDKMLENKVMNDGEIELGPLNQGEKVRAVVDMVRKKGSKASSVFIAALCELDPCLAEDLKLK